MRALQWIIVPLGIALLLCIAAFPFTHYAVITDLDNPTVDEEGKPVGDFKGWKNGLLFVREIDRLNNYRLTSVPEGLTSGPQPHAKPNWVVNISLVCGVVVLCAFIFGWRPTGDPKKKEVVRESLAGFAALGMASVICGAMAVYLSVLSWRLLSVAVIIAIVSGIRGIILLWANYPSQSPRTDSTSSE